MAPVCFTEEDILGLIEMVHSRECLWDIKSKKYRNSVLREQAWKEIGASLNITATEAYKRFRSIRDKYRRELKKAKKSSKCGSQATLWPFFNQLRFLDEMLRTRRSGYKPTWHPLQDTNNQSNDSAVEKFNIFTNTSVSGSAEDPSGGIASTIKVESPLSVTGSSINDDEEFSSAFMLSKATPLARTPSHRQLSSPINKPSKGRHPDQSSSLENTFSENTDKLISAISNARLSVQPKPFDDVIEFIRNSLISLPHQESKQLEKEIMTLCTKGPICFTEEETFSFIKMVHSHECLWNIKSKMYKDVVKRNKVWKQIGVALNITGNEAYTKFRSMREKYQRELKKVKKSSKSESDWWQATLWPFFNHLRFLDEVPKRRRACYKSKWVPLKDTNNQINDSTQDKFEIFTITSVSGATEDASMEEHNNVGVSADGFSSTIKIESPLSVAGSSINDDEECSSASMLSKGTPLVRTPSPRQLSSPINQPSTRGRAVRPTSLENTFSENTDKLISAISNAKLSVQPKPFDDVIEFIRKTLISLPQQESNQLEKEIMASCTKYRYK